MAETKLPPFCKRHFQLHFLEWKLLCFDSNLTKLCSQEFNYPDDVIKWKHFPRYWPFVRGIHRSPVNSLHKGHWRVALMFSLICVCINGWVNNREAGDLRRYRAHYDVTIMWIKKRWFRSRLGAKQTTKYHLNQRWSSLHTHICVTRPQWVKCELFMSSIS